MITVRWIERIWDATKYGQLTRELLRNRPEGLVDARIGINPDGSPRAVAAAALALIRLDELSQSNAPLGRKLVRTILACQERDGGWGDVVTTALCTRALLCGDGHGVAIDRAMEYFRLLQKPEGIWPLEPLRRLPGDALASALVLLQLGDAPAFQSAIDLESALHWFEDHAGELDADTKSIWSHARLRCRTRHTRELATFWS